MIKNIKKMTSKELNQEIKNLEQILNIKINEDFNKAHECCPDVCNLIKTIIAQEESKLTNIDKKSYELEEIVSKLGLKKSKTHPQMIHNIAKKEFNTIKERIDNLKRLSMLLKENDICNCKF